jgi:predicted alpha/beta-hydrolase family hydrolase
MLFVQGSRDTFGTPTELEPVLATLRAPATLHVIEGGDHSFKVAKSGPRQAQVLLEMQQAVVTWLRGVIAEGA